MIAQDRRSFLKTAASAGALVVVGLPSGCAAPGSSEEEQEETRLGLYLRLTPDGGIAIGAPSSEIGQGTWTAIPMLIAEELDVRFEDVEIEPIPLSYQDTDEGVRPATFMIGAGGSTAIASSWQPARQAGAGARYLLRAAASRLWEVPLDAVTTRDGVVHHRDSGRSAPYSSLIALAQQETLPEGDLPLKRREDLRIVGRPQHDKQAEKIVRGEPLYGIDQRYPNMVYAVIARAPRFDAEPLSVDDTAALRVPGVLRTVRIEGPGPGGDYTHKPIANGIAVVAETLWAALRGRDALDVTWSDGPMAGIGSGDLRAQIDRQMENRGQMLREDGDTRNAFAAADRTHEARYDIPIVSHATLEPQGCIADVRDDGCTIICSTQTPWGCMDHAREILGLEAEQIEIRNIRNGGGFGRRLDSDYAVEAILVSREIGRPVRVHWTREDDLRHDFYRPLVHHRLSAALDERGAIAGWRHRLASTARYFRRGIPPEELYIPEYWTDDLPAQLVDNVDIEYHFLETAIPFGPWRAPGHTANAFAVESFIDELAERAGIDPVEFRLSLFGEPRELPYEQHGGPIYDTGRHAGVLRLAAERAGWGGSSPPGRGRGIATHFTFGTYVAHVVDVTMGDEGAFSVDRVVSAIDCGIVVNPNGARGQNEGGINDALSTALGQQITIADGQVEQSNFDSYEMMRIDRAATNIETYFVDSDKDPSGMGEAPVPPFAPALANALYDATGRRIRRLPIGNALATA